MSATRELERKRLRDRYLHLALLEELSGEGPGDLTERIETLLEAGEAAGAVGEVEGGDGGGDVEIRMPRRIARWPAAVAAASVLLVAIWMVGRGGGAASSLEGGELTGVVIDPSGRPVEGAKVRLVLGWAGDGVVPNRRFVGAARREATSDAKGMFVVASVPAGARGMVLATHGSRFARVPAEDRMTVTLREAGTVRGRISGDRQVVRRARVWFRGDGFDSASGKVDEDGDFTIEGAAPGPGVLGVQYANWLVARLPIVVESAGETRVRSVRIREDRPLSPDPLADARTVRLVDGDRRPLAGVQLVWSSPWMDGGMNSDEDGEVKLVGGGVAIGGPPFLLRLGSLKGPDCRYAGKLLGVRGGSALVQLTPLREVRGRVHDGRTPVTECGVFFLMNGKSPRTYTGRMEGGEYVIAVPPGRGTLLVVPPDGRVHREELEVGADEASLPKDVVLER